MTTKMAAPRRRILVLAWRDIDDPLAGGSELYVHEVTAALQRAGHDVRVLTGGVAGQSSETTRNGVRVLRRGGRLTNVPITMARAAFIEQRRADLVIDVWNGIPFMSPVWSRRPRAAVMHHLHGRLWYDNFPKPVAAVGDFFERRVFPRLYRRTTVVTLGEASKGELVDRCNFVTDRVHAVAPGIHEQYVPGGKLTTNPSVIVVARLVPAKQVHIALEVIRSAQAQIPDLSATVVGSGPDRDRLMAMAPPGVTFAGRVDDAELVAMYQHAWLVLSASNSEGWGMTITEAAACGTPAVALAEGGHLDAIVADQTGILADTVDDLTLAVVAIGADIDYRNRLGTAAQKRAQTLTWDNTAAQLLAIAEGARS